MKYQWLLFDADDTLFDFTRAEANALQWTLEEIGLQALPAYIQHYSRVNQQVWKEFERGEVSSQELRVRRFRLFFEQTGLAGDEHRTSALYLKNLARGTDLLDGAEELINSLRGKVKLALVTNGLKDVQRPRLERSVLRDSFDRVFISEELGVSKPSHAFFDRVHEGIGRPPLDQVLIIGDSLTSDIQGGLDFGIDTCWYNPRGQMSDLRVTYEIAHLGQLIPLLI